jgi:hypothetical protein
MPEIKPTIYPTLVIGLGGTGTDVVRYAKRRFLRAWHGGESAASGELPDVLQVLAVDTEPLVNPADEEPLYSHEFAFLGRFDATRLVQNRHSHTPYLDWWRWDEQDIPLGYIHNGARQLRPIGRLAFYRNYVTFKTLMVDKLRAMRQLSAIQEAEERGFPVAADHRLIYIITSICGGTGAGMFHDVAHRVRAEVGSNADIIGLFLMPSTFEQDVRSDLQRRRIQANAYAALKELNYFHETQDFQAYYPGEQGPLPTVKYRAFTRVFLVERTNVDGRTLSGKRQAEQMIAHLIHLMSISHMNKRILGLDVNVTEERTMFGREAAPVSGREPLRHYLSYSSFSTSALVMPQAALWRYFLSIVSFWSIEMLQNGQDSATDEERCWLAYLALRDDLKSEFTRYQFTDEEMRALQEDQAHNDGRWRGFTTAVANAVRRAVATDGLQGARYLVHRLSLAEDAAELVRDDLAHPRQRPFEEVPEVKRASMVKQLLISPRELAEREKARQRWDLYTLRLDTWRSVLNGLQVLARNWEREIDRISGELMAARESAGRDAAEAAGQVHPLHRQGDADTSTYYDLETGAVNQELLDAYLEVSNSLLEQPVADVEGAPARWDVLLDVLRDHLLRHFNPESADPGASISASGLQSLVETQFSQNTELAAVHTEVAATFDVRNVIQAQQTSSARPANYRVRQLFDRMAPHLAVDGDTFPYSEADEEHIRLVATPAAMEDEPNPAFRQAMRGYDDFEWVPTGDPNRIDACHIVHGLPLVQLSSMPELYRHYMSGVFDKETLHVQADWVDFPEIYIPPSVKAKAPPSGPPSVDQGADNLRTRQDAPKPLGAPRKPRT